MTPITTQLSFGGFLLLAALGGAQARPPTLDPTYGLPLPAKAPAAAPADMARWVWADTTRDGQMILFRRALDLAAAPRRAALYLTADDFFTLYVNGREIDHSGPDPKDNNVWQHVHRVNLAPLLTARRCRWRPASRARSACARPGAARIL